MWRKRYSGDFKNIITQLRRFRNQDESSNDKLILPRLNYSNEDIVLRPDEVSRLLQLKLGFELRNGIASWDRLKDNIESNSSLTKMIPYMHKLRNFDPESIGKWKDDKQKRQYIESLLSNHSLSTKINQFLKDYNYT